MKKLNVSSYCYNDENVNYNNLVHVGFIMEELYELFPNTCGLYTNLSDTINEQNKITFKHKPKLSDFTEEEIKNSGIDYNKFLLYLFIGFREHVNNYEIEKNDAKTEYLFFKQDIQSQINDIIGVFEDNKQSINILNNRLKLKSQESTSNLLNNTYDNLKNENALLKKQLEINNNQLKDLEFKNEDLQLQINGLKDDFNNILEDIKLLKISVPPTPSPLNKSILKKTNTLTSFKK